MPQRYKVRLGDGTFMSVDMDGLRAWVHDARAVAQAVGSQQWRPIQDVITEEESAARLLRALIHPQPKKEATPPPVEPPAPRTPTPPSTPRPEPEPSPALIEPPSYAPASYAPPSYSPPSFGQPLAFGEPAFGEPAPPSEPAAFEAPPAYGEPAARDTAAPRETVQTLADETRSTGATSGSYTVLPPIRMKPLEDEQQFRSAWDEREEGHESEAEPRNDHLDGPLLTVLAPLGGFLSRVLTPLSSLTERWTRRSARRAESSYPSLSEPSPLPEVEKGPSLGERLSEAWSGLRARLRRPEPAPEPEPTPEPEPEAEPAPQMPRLSRTPTPPRSVAPREHASSAARVSVAPQRAPVVPPPPLSSISVLPLAESVRPREPEDVYEEEEPSELFGPIWFWTKRLVVLGGLAALGSYAYRERDQWFPKAADVGQSMFTAIDRTARSRQRAEQQQRALGEATTKLPHLTPQTILLLFGQSPTGVLDPPELFQLAREAAERGQGKLLPAEAQELRVLQHELATTLRPPERRRLEEYDQARTRRVIFPFENPYAMDLVAKGARALPAERLERLRALTQQAVAAGIAVPVAEPKDAAAR